MNDVIFVTILQRASNLPCELPCNALAEATIFGDIVEHRAAVYVFKYHVIMVLMDDHLAHAAYVWMVEQLG
jgi:hypothetical protein